MPKSLWKVSLNRDEYWGTPIVVDGRMVGMDHENPLKSVDLRTGVIADSRLINMQGGDVTASPAMAGDRLYFVAPDTTTLVTSAKPPYEELARNRLYREADRIRASPVFAGTRMYLRTFEFLYCISEDKPPG